MATTLNIELSRNGVDRVRSSADSVARGVELGELIQASSLYLQLLNDGVSQHFAGTATAQQETADEPEVLVPTIIDGEPELPRKIRIQTGVLPRDPFDAPPAWFIGGIRKMFFDYRWDEVSKPLSRERLLAYHTPEYVEKHKDVSTEKLNEMHQAPYCDPVEETALSLFSSRVSTNRLFDHWGWVEHKDGEDILVSEPYGCTQENLKDLITICDQLRWTFSIVGVSGHFPSATIRIEIRPR
jgi:hypothetical protein